MVRFAAAAALGLLLAIPTARAQDIADQQRLAPLRAVSADIGQRHFVSYFQQVDRRCELTILSVTRMDESARTAPDDVQRLRVAIGASSFARLDTPNGADALQFDCSADAARMIMTVLHRVAEY